MKPLLKWTGGKRWLAEGMAAEIAALKPTVYVEPFLGAGAVALEVEAERYLLGDANSALINLWEHVVLYPRALYTRVRLMEQLYKHEEKGYAGARSLLNSLRREGMLTNEPASAVDAELMRGARLDLAALVLYLIAHGYNGLWRENSDGDHNVPWGGAHQNRFNYPSEGVLLEVSTKFRGKATFFPTDFEEIIAAAPRGAVIYADPPYVNAYDGYTADGFDEDDQARLAACLMHAAERGVHVFASNSDHELVRELYAWADVADVTERWTVGATGARRGKKGCLLIRSQG